MKNTHYDVLQVSPKASLDVIKAAYQHLKPMLVNQINEGNEEARNQSLFLEEAYSVLSSAEKRSNYDASLLGVAKQPNSIQTYVYETDGTFLSWWADSKTGRVLLAIGFFLVIFSAYKFMGQRGEQKI